MDDGEADELSLRTTFASKFSPKEAKNLSSKIDLPYLGSYRIKDISARTVKADGTIVELKKDDVFDRTALKANGLKVKAKIVRHAWG